MATTADHIYVQYAMIGNVVGRSLPRIRLSSVEEKRPVIKGCPFRTGVGGLMVYIGILCDAVAGGAGHVRRMALEDGQVFQQVLRRALSVVDSCSCDTSCYQCLRNYYNPMIHDQLSRRAASSFLHP